MANHYAYYDCPVCGEQIEVGAEYEPADRSVGLPVGYLIPDGAPDRCSDLDCGAVYTGEQQTAIDQQLAHYAEMWRPDTLNDEPDDAY